MTIAERKKIELQQKLASLQSEFEDWRKKSKAFQPLEKHQSQIHRVTLQLENLNQQIKSALDQLSTSGQEVLTEARNLELAMLESHRVWDFFRSKLSLRSIEWFSKYLTAADELAWECYNAAQKKLDPNYLAPGKVKEPPLVFFNGGSSPFTLPRDYDFEAEAVPDEEIKNKQVMNVLRALPIPVIGVPWFQVQHLPEMLVVAHEVGHDVESDFKLTPDLLQAVNKADIDEDRLDAWRAWLGEIFADIYGVLSCGPAFVRSLIDFLADDPNQTMRARQTGPDWDLYPTDYLRVLINIEALDSDDFANERTQLLKQWTDIYTEHAMTGYDKDIPKIVKAIIDGPYTAFGGASLRTVLSFSATDQYYVEEDARRLAKGQGPKSENVRRLFAAANTAFADNPTKYGEQNAHELVLDRANVLRKAAGVRGSENTSGAQLGTFDEEDKAAGKALFDLLITK